MARELNEILQELNTVAESLDVLDYTREASDLRNLSDMIRTGGKISQRIRKVSQKEETKFQ